MRGARNSTLVAAGILLSRLSGLVRERAVAHFLGTSAALDAYRAALRIPNLLQNLLGEGVLSAGFIPSYSRLVDQGREEEAGRLAGAVLGLLGVVAGAAAVVGVLLAEPITSVIAAGLTGERRELTVDLVRVLFPALAVLVLSAWCLGVLNSHRRFFLSYVAPVLWNVAQIAALVGVGVWLLGGVPAGEADPSALTTLAWALALGTLAGSLLQLLVQLPAVLRLSGGHLRVRLRPRDAAVREGVGRVVRASGPVVLGRGAVQLSAYLDTLLASFLVAGALGVLGYAQILYLLPISLFGMSVAAAELPELATERDREVVRGRLDDGLGRVAFPVLGTAVAFVVAGDLIVATLLQTGAFDARDVAVVWVVLGAYALGLLAATSSRLLQSALYGLDAPGVAAAVSGARVALSALLGAALMLQADQLALTAEGVRVVGELPATAPEPAEVREAAVGPPRLGAAGLAVAATAGAWLELGLLWRAVARRVRRPRLAGGALGRLLVAGLAAGAVGLALRPLAAALPVVVDAVVVLGAMGLAYLAVARATGVRQARELTGWAAGALGRRGRG